PSLCKVLDRCPKQQATYRHVQAGHPFAYRVDGKLRRISQDQFPAPTNEEIMRILGQAFSSSVFQRIEKQHEMDLSFVCEKVRYRANFNKQQGTQSFSFRVVPQKIPKLNDLQLPSSVADLVQQPRGLLLVAGATGQGKSTTACALLQQLNHTLALRIIPIEDPVDHHSEE